MLEYQNTLRTFSYKCELWVDKFILLSINEINTYPFMFETFTCTCYNSQLDVHTVTSAGIFQISQNR